MKISSITKYCWEISAVYVSPQGEDNCRFAPGLSWALPMYLFPLLVLMFAFTVTNINIGRTAFLSSASPSGKWLTLQMVLGISKTTIPVYSLIQTSNGPWVPSLSVPFSPFHTSPNSSFFPSRGWGPQKLPALTLGSMSEGSIFVHHALSLASEPLPNHRFSFGTRHVIRT